MNLTSRDLKRLNQLFVKWLELPGDQIQACARGQLEEGRPACRPRRVRTRRPGSKPRSLGEAPSHFPSGRDREVALEFSCLVCNIKSTRGSAAAMKGPS